MADDTKLIRVGKDEAEFLEAYKTAKGLASVKEALQAVLDRAYSPEVRKQVIDLLESQRLAEQTTANTLESLLGDDLEGQSVLVA
ncbi:MAG: hypothetical protein AAGK74_00660 [Chloroflexota bacterium]